MGVRLKRVYEPPGRADDVRVLVDRLWLRGLSKQAARIDRWAKELAPSSELRRWFLHDPARWPGFNRRSARELAAAPQVTEELTRLSSKTTLTFLYASRDGDRNNAVALAEYLMRAGIASPRLIRRKEKSP
jgi:uncharacterized protein YeaO (DUF488 family)